MGIPDAECWLTTSYLPTGVARGWRRTGCLASLIVVLILIVLAVLLALIGDDESADPTVVRRNDVLEDVLGRVAPAGAVLVDAGRADDCRDRDFDRRPPAVWRTYASHGTSYSEGVADVLERDGWALVDAGAGSFGGQIFEKSYGDWAAVLVVHEGEQSSELGLTAYDDTSSACDIEEEG